MRAEVWDGIRRYEMRTFDTGATRDDDAGKLDFEGFLSQPAIFRFAEYMHQHRVQPDGSLRASDNWQKGIPEDAYMKSAFRHFFDVWRLHRKGDLYTPEGQDALCALLFNVQGLLHEAVRTGPPIQSRLEIEQRRQFRRQP